VPEYGKMTAAGKKDFVDKSIRLIDATINEIRILTKSTLRRSRVLTWREQIQSMVKIMEEGIGFRISLEYEIPEQAGLPDDLKLNILSGCSGTTEQRIQTCICIPVCKNCHGEIQLYIHYPQWYRV
jgi:hypothetical protein